MKSIKVLLIAVFLLAAGSSLQQAAAQEKSKAEQERDAKLQQEIDLQKKALTEQKKAQADADRILKDQQFELDNSFKQIQDEAEVAGQSADAYKVLSRRGARAFSTGEPFMFSSSGGDSFYGHSFGGDSERTTWDFSKSVKENTFSRDYTFDVEKTSTSVIMSVMGDCKSGEIRIKIVTPGGKTYSDIVIDASGNLNWRKSFSLSETENQDKTGEWKFQIASNKATGFFKISLQTF